MREEKAEGTVETILMSFENVDVIQKGETNSEYFFHNLKILLKEQIVYQNDKIIPLSHQEFLAFQHLIKHPSWVCTKEQIYDAVYGEKIVEDIDNAVYCLIRNIRKKLEPDPHHPKYIQTVRGVGYKFIIPEE